MDIEINTLRLNCDIQFELTGSGLASSDMNKYVKPLQIVFSNLKLDRDERLKVATCLFRLDKASVRKKVYGDSDLYLESFKDIPLAYAIAFNKWYFSKGKPYEPAKQSLINFADKCLEKQSE